MGMKCHGKYQSTDYNHNSKQMVFKMIFSSFRMIWSFPSLKQFTSINTRSLFPRNIAE